MPINKVPVVHKFGIISYSQRLELQERLLKQSFPDGPDSRQSAVHSTRKPLEISEEFIQQYNNASNLDEKEKFEDLARKILERIKRRSGVRVGSQGQHVNLPLAWTELSQLAQCKGGIQEDCLDVLIVSLDQAPLESYHIPALFFLAETMLYWLRTDVIHQPFLRTTELKLLRMGQLVFTRLFYHHMAGELQGEQLFKSRLFTYLDGLRDCQDAYNPYPNALLSLRFVIEVGKIILSDVDLDPGEVKEGDQSDNRSASLGDCPATPKSTISASKSAQSLPTPPDTPRKLLSARSADKPKVSPSDQSATSGGLSTSIHNLSPSLWHSLDVWRCTNHLSGGLSHALSSLARCGTGLANESWIDSSCSMLILAEAAKTRLCVLKAMQSIAVGQIPVERMISPPTSSRSQITDVLSLTSADPQPLDTTGSGGDVSSKPSLSDIFERSEEGDTHSESKTRRSEGGSASSREGDSERSSKSNGGDRRQSCPAQQQSSHGRKSKNEIQTDTYSTEADGNGLKMLVGVDAASSSVVSREKDVYSKFASPSRPKPSLKAPNSSLKSTNVREVSFDDSSGQVSGQPVSQRTLSANQKTEDSLAAQSHDTGHRPEVGTADLGGRDSQTSSVPTYTNQPPPSGCGLDSWHWETAIMYTEMMASICLYGNSSLIQKRALMGGHSDLSSAVRRGPVASPLQSASLLDLIRFKSSKETMDGSRNDWSWRVRYGAIQSLVKICRCLTNDRPREGLRNIAWAALMHAHSTERDDRVLEALKVGEVFSSLEKLCNGRETPNVCVLGGRLAAGLAKIYLPPLPPPVNPPTSKGTQLRRSQLTGSLNQPLFTSQPLRTSVREEIDLVSTFAVRPPDFNSRTSFDLRRIVEDQWRKELQTTLDDDETERQENLAATQRREEVRQRKLAVNKSKKFDHKTVSV